MKLSRIVPVVLLSFVLVPLGASAASADPYATVVDAYCDAFEAAGGSNVQDCRFLIQ